MMVAERDTEISDIEEAWHLVDELGEHSRRLLLAARAAGQSLGLPDQEDSP